MVVHLVAALGSLLAAGAFEKYQQESETVCVGKPDLAFETPDSWTVQGHVFTVQGARAQVRRELPGKSEVAGRLGLLSAVKDFSPETQANLQGFVAAFKKADVTGIVVAGDSAYGVDDQDSTMESLFSYLGEQGLPVYALIGNSESRSSFNRAVLAAYKKHPNVINLDLVRRVEGEGFTLVSLPGYFDKRYIHESSGCLYKSDDLQDLARLAKDAPAPVVLVSHGPPRQEGKQALDATVDGHNVGDPALANAIAEAHISYGVFGHILEAGGRATDLLGKKQVRPLVPSAALFLNPGPAFADPWELNGGGVSHGMAAILILKNGKAEWQHVTPAAPKAKGRAPARERVRSR